MLLEANVHLKKLRRIDALLVHVIDTQARQHAHASVAQASTAAASPSDAPRGEVVTVVSALSGDPGAHAATAASLLTANETAATSEELEGAAQVAAEVAVASVSQSRVSVEAFAQRLRALVCASDERFVWQQPSAG